LRSDSPPLSVPSFPSSCSFSTHHPAHTAFFDSVHAPRLQGLRYGQDAVSRLRSTPSSVNFELWCRDSNHPARDSRHYRERHDSPCECVISNISSPYHQHSPSIAGSHCYRRYCVAEGDISPSLLEWRTSAEKEHITSANGSAECKRAEVISQCWLRAEHLIRGLASTYQIVLMGGLDDRKLLAVVLGGRIGHSEVVSSGTGRADWAIGSC